MFAALLGAAVISGLFVGVERSDHVEPTSTTVVATPTIDRFMI